MDSPTETAQIPFGRKRGRPRNEKRVWKTQVTLDEEDAFWLKKHPQYSPSGLLKWAIRKHMEMEKQLAGMR